MDDIEIQENEQEVVTGIETGAEDAKTEESSTSTDEGKVDTGEAGQKTAEAAGEATEDESKVPAWAKKRFDELTRKRHEAEREAAYLKGQLEGTGKKPEEAKPLAQAEEDPEPRAEQFDNYDAYMDSRTAWRARQEFHRLEREKVDKAAKAEAERKSEETAKTFTERVEKAKEKFQDFEAVAFNPNLQVTKTMFEAIQDSEAGPEIVYHLGKNPEEAKRIAGLSPIAVIREIGKLEAKLATPPAQVQAQTKKITDAPPPPSTVDGNSGGAQKDPSKMSDDEWYAHWKNEQAQKRAAGRK